MQQVLFILCLTIIAMTTSKSLIKQDICSLASETGKCRAAMIRFFYNQSSGKCEQFIYGGCGGNANNFSTLDECNARCSNVCSLPSVRGNCRAAMIRFFYNQSSGKCEQFTYGGCGGNANNFSTLDECNARCS